MTKRTGKTLFKCLGVYSDIHARHLTYIYIYGRNFTLKHLAIITKVRMTFITSSVTTRLSALFLTLVFAATLFSVAPASVAQASWDWADVGSGCCGAWDTGSNWDLGSNWDTGSDWDLGSNWDTGSGWDLGSNWDTGSGWDLGSNWDTGSDWDLGSGWDTGSGWDLGSSWDTGSGWDLGSNWDAGSGWDLGSNWDTGSDWDLGTNWDTGSNWDLGGGIAGYVTPEEGGIAGYVTPEGGIAGYVTPSRGYYSPGGYVHPATTPIRSIATARQNVSNVANRSNIQNVRNIQNINRVSEINRITEQVRNIQTQVANIQQQVVALPVPVKVAKPQPVVVRGGQQSTVVRYAYPTPVPTVRPIITSTPRPNITVAQSGATGAYEYLNISSLPYTGTDDIAYVLGLVAVALGSGAGLFLYKGQILGALAGLTPAFAFGHLKPTSLHEEIQETNDETTYAHDPSDEAETKAETQLAHTLSLEEGEDGPRLSFIAK